MKIQMFHLMPWTEASDDVAWPYSEDQFDPEIGPGLYEDYLSQFEYCEELGFDAVGVNEHHYTAYGLMPSPNLVASNIANRTSDIQISVMGNVLPIRGHPIRVAEEIAMLDNISDGRILSGFVRGIPTEYSAYNVNPDESRGRFSEAWDLILEAWTNDKPFDWNGEYYEYDDVYIWPRPVQDPHPPLWMPAESEKSLRYAAKHQVPIGQVYVSTQEFKEGVEFYRKVAKEEYGWEPTDEYFWPARFIYVADTMEQAREEAEPHLEYFFSRLWGGLYRAGARDAVEGTAYREDDSFDYKDHTPEQANKALDYDFDALQEGGEIIVGDPSYVTEQIEQEYEDVGGFGRLVALFQFGTLPDHLVRRNMELFADEVMPEIRKL